jgi:aminoglycoside phosphotransferase family enzyme
MTNVAARRGQSAYSIPKESRGAFMNTSDAMRAFLNDPRHYEGGGSVTLHETHGAWVGVGGNIAIKVKKPVLFPYMDYSTP